MVGLRLLILNQFFYPDISATSQLMTDLAQDLAEEGIEVTALCANAAYIGQAQLPPSEMWGKVRIERVAVVGFDRKNLLRRASSYVSFYITAFLRLLTLPRQHVILVLTTPPLIAVVAYAMRLLRGSKMVYLVQDVYPDIAIEFGVLRRGSLSAKFFERLNRFLLRKADAIIALGSCMRERLLAKGASDEKITVIPNWADGSQIKPLPHQANPFRAEIGLADKFVVLYSGNMGRAHDFTAIFGSMERLTGEPGIVFLFIGSGARREELERFIREHPAANVRVMDYVPRERLPYTMAAADLALVAVADGLEGLVVPSKLYGIMAAGRPALYLGPESGEAARTILAHRCGYVVRNGDVDGFVAAIRTAHADPQARTEMGRRAREAFEREFGRMVASRKYLQVLQRVTKV